MTPADLIAALPGPVLVIGAGQQIELANAAAEKLLGAQIAGRHYVTVLRQPAVADAIEAVIRDGRPRETRFLGRRHETDTTWSVFVRRVCARPDSRIVVAFEDRTAAEEAGQIRRDFVANVSHELKTPLTALIGYIETLRGPARDDATARERFLATMDREAHRMNRLVSDLLSLSRVEANERVRPSEDVDMGMMLASVVASLRPMAEDRGMEMSLDMPPDEITVRGDTDQLRQVFSNLIENAVKYGGAKVEVRLERSSHVADLRRAGVVVGVRDDGPGIARTHLPRLTERFYRIDTHRSRAVGGTGLGLAIVKHIVSRHRGRLRIASTRGQGSVFTVLLPIDG